MDYGNGNIGVMKMWKCKHCGGTKFKEEINGEVETSYLKDKMCIYYIKTLKVKRPKLSITCINCGNKCKTDEEINKIATWEEEDD